MVSYRARLVGLGALSLILIAIYLVIQSGGHWDYVLPRRAAKVAAIIMTGSAVAVSTVIFQTISNNRILTPSIIGFDSLYLLIQTAIIFVVGSGPVWIRQANVNFVVSVVLMVGFALILYRTLFSRQDRGILFVLLLGVVMGTLFQSLSSVLQVLLDPNEFMFVQDRMFASFNNVRVDLLRIALVLLAAIGLYLTHYTRYLDVLALGRDHAVSLGVDYNRIVNRLLIVVAALISVSTALVGPITFLGLLVANLAYQFLDTHRHSVLLLGAALIAVVALVGGQLIVERLLSFSTTLSVIINFVGGIYFITLLLKESRA